MNLAIMYDGMGDRQKAVAAYRRAIELDPANELCIRAMKLKLLEEK
jgi:Flp pilus assembly protein TadD